LALPDPVSRSPAGSTPWHALPAERVLAECASTTAGLADEEAAARFARNGPNRLAAAPRRGPVARFLGQFDNLLIYVLIASSVVTALMGHWIDTGVIVAVVLVNGLIGHIQEGRAEEALDAIRQMVGPHASVLRAGRRIAVPADQLVGGDIVLLEAGDRVAADLRLLHARGLRIEEAVLTGESVAVDKTDAPAPEAAPLAERGCMAFSGTLVAAGQGRGVVVATGAGTELGRISTLLQDVQTLDTPLVRQMNRFARLLTFVILSIAAGTFAFATGLGGMHWEDAFMVVVALAVAAIPEGLPAVMTVALAIGVRRMAARHAIVRRMPAVEALGAVSVICSDKTGTLTRNQMTVRQIRLADAVFDVEGAGYEPKGGLLRDGRPADPAEEPRLMEFVRAGILCNDAALRQGPGGWTADGDPMEAALVSLGLKAGLQPDALRREEPRTDEIPFDAAHRFMATLHHDHQGRHWIVMKGAPEDVLARCAGLRGADGEAPVDPRRWTEAVEAMAGEGLRVLALAVKPVDGSQRELTFDDVAGGLTLLGLVGLMDPPREEVAEAIRDCRGAGIAVKMITGDHAATALAIARQLGLTEDPVVVSGAALERMDEAELRAVALEATVFARATPEHKLRLVEALQADGAVIAMTGDGVNDAPALKRADVGVAMGLKGTEAAKEAAEVVLADDNFASIVAAVREGRTVYDNLTKMIAWTLPTNGGEALAVLAAILFGLALPISAVHILWINLTTAVALGMTLAFEPTEAGTMRRPPRPIGRPLLSGFLVWRTVLVSSLMALGVFGAYDWSAGRGASAVTAQTLAVNVIVAMEIAYLFSIRFLYGASLTWKGVLGTPAVLTGIAVTAVAQLALTHLPVMNRLFGTAPLSATDWGVVIALGAGLFAVLELEKVVRRLLPP